MDRDTAPDGSAPDGFAQFVRDRSRELLRAGWLLTGDWAQAEDLVQVALSQAWPRWSGLDAPAAYVHRIMLTTYLRSRRRRWTSEITFADVPDVPRLTDDFSAVEERGDVARALSVLPPRQRAVIVLRYFADLTEAETARVLGCSVGSVKTHGSRALSTLRSTPGVAEILRGGVTS